MAKFFELSYDGYTAAPEQMESNAAYSLRGHLQNLARNGVTECQLRIFSKSEIGEERTIKTKFIELNPHKNYLPIVKLLCK